MTTSDINCNQDLCHFVIKEKTNLHDDVAEADQLRDAKRAKLPKTMKITAKAAKGKTK